MSFVEMATFYSEMAEKRNYSLKLLAAQKTKFHADSVEWCPLKYRDHFACGTYQLEEGEKPQNSTQVRQGNIMLCQLIPDESSSSGFSLTTKDSVDCSGVLDMKWSPQYINDACVLGVALSDGTVQLLKVAHDHEDNPTILLHMCTKNLSDENKPLALSLDWSSWNDFNTPGCIIVSDSSGYLSHMRLRSSDLYIENRWKAHEYEAWATAFDHMDTNLIFSGGDDCLLKVWDIRAGQSTPVASSGKHSMGVTAISKSKSKCSLLATGSYDEGIFLWDSRRFKTPMSEIYLGGGIWRLKWHPTLPQYLLAAAMNSGIYIVELDEIDYCMEIGASYDSHTSLAYGVDWCYMSETTLSERPTSFRRLSSTNLKSKVASCSFYDNSLHVWELNATTT